MRNRAPLPTMQKTLLYRLFKVGKIPNNILPVIQREGIVMQDEGLSSSITYRNFRAPGRRYGWKRHWFSGSIALTQARLLVFMDSKAIVSTLWHDTKMVQLNFLSQENETLCIAFEASAFNENCTGEVEVRISTPLAQPLLKTIQQKTALPSR